MTKDLNVKLDLLKSILNTYTNILVYIFLRMIKLDAVNNKNSMDKIINEVEQIIGYPFSQWPENIKVYHDELWLVLPQENIFKLYREIIYYLIFIISGHAHKYIKSSEYKLMLDRLFEIFKIPGVPWLENPPEKNAYNKYNEAENPLAKFALNEIGKRTGQDDLLFLMDYSNYVMSIFKHAIIPTIDKIFLTPPHSLRPDVQ